MRPARLAVLLTLIVLAAAGCYVVPAPPPPGPGLIPTPPGFVVANPQCGWTYGTGWYGWGWYGFC